MNGSVTKRIHLVFKGYKGFTDYVAHLPPEGQNQLNLLKDIFELPRAPRRSRLVSAHEAIWSTPEHTHVLQAIDLENPSLGGVSLASRRSMGVDEHSKD